MRCDCYRMRTIPIIEISQISLPNLSTNDTEKSKPQSIPKLKRFPCCIIKFYNKQIKNVNCTFSWRTIRSGWEIRCGPNQRNGSIPAWHGICAVCQSGRSKWTAWRPSIPIHSWRTTIHCWREKATSVLYAKVWSRNSRKSEEGLWVSSHNGFIRFTCKCPIVLWAYMMFPIHYSPLTATTIHFIY